MARLICEYLALVLVLINNNEAARILAVFPSPVISHQVVFRPLTQELAKRGHDVVVITPDPAFPNGQAPENLTEINVHDVSYAIWWKQMLLIQKNQINPVEGFVSACRATFEEQTKVPAVQDIITNSGNSFDLLLVEAWTRFALGFSHVIKGPSIAVSSFGATNYNLDAIGAPTHLLLYPQPMQNRIFNLSIREMILQYILLFLVNEYSEISLGIENSLVKRIFGKSAPNLKETEKNIQKYFLNLHPVWDNYRPVPPGVLYMGGLHQKPEKELPKDLKNYLDSSTNGVIYISFGTNMDPKLLSPVKIQTIIKAVSQLPYDVLFKWNEDELPGRTKNIKISKWFPQSDLLRHPKIKLFITQGGLQSTDEAITAGVPLIGIPIMGDQWYNTEKYVHHKIGLQLDLGSLEADSLRKAIETVIGDKSYRENVIRLRTIMTDQPISAIDRAVWWTEYVLRHGGSAYLRSPAADMPWTQYYEIKLVFIVLTVVIAVVVFILMILSKIFKMVLRQVTKTLRVLKLPIHR